ncbi:hypothetical protein [Schinkia azotoformans]|uniref:hypothetical protein n=1 Tax=Schinkia azotoformans TaxID=1454 RepID=UPI002DBCDE4D|nr:hypothetical protein [Schinkia azotoformans]MEC1717709.1 hypothetical protein [Schinkia azotoformans]MEC1747822.1 hypothetical protein [Schinkia azotoformans]MEC1760466.1 hypothetical protein [Schinkia azotoformans]MED4378399.1 hypothetical protein [Schinkia azotoformans]
MYSNYYGNMVPNYRQGYEDQRWFLAAPIATGLLGLGVGYLGGLATPRPCCYPGFGAGFGPGFGPGFGGYGGFGNPFFGGPGFF